MTYSIWFLNNCVDKAFKLLGRLRLWFNRHMTIVLTAVGSALMATAMFLLSRATVPPTTSWWWHLPDVIICLIIAGVVWSLALYREWKRERKQNQEREDRETREIERERREIERHEERMKSRAGEYPIVYGKNDNSQTGQH